MSIMCCKVCGDSVDTDTHAELITDYGVCIPCVMETQDSFDLDPNLRMDQMGIPMKLLKKILMDKESY